MFDDYLIFDSLREKINNSNLAKKIEKYKHDLDRHVILSMRVTDSDIKSIIDELREGGFLKTLPKEEKESWKKCVEDIYYNNRKPANWKMFRPKESEVETENEFIYLISGFYSSLILKPNEIWNYKKFGFNSLSSFVGGVGACVMDSTNLHSREGYIWNTKHSDGKIIRNEITGSEHADLRIFQTDVTEYKTVDPLGNEVEYRPFAKDDSRWVSAYHSTETEFLGAVLKYAENRKISEDELQKIVFDLKEYANTLTSGSITCAEHISPNSISPRIVLNNLKYPMGEIDANGKVTQKTIDYIFANTESSYGCYLKDNSDLVITYATKNDDIQTIVATFQKSDIPEILKGLVYQSIKHLGRTSIYDIINMLDYRISDNFWKENTKEY